MLTVSEFFDRHLGDLDVMLRLAAACDTMADAWLRADPETLVWIAVQPGVLSDDDLYTFSRDCFEAARAALVPPAGEVLTLICNTRDFMRGMTMSDAIRRGQLPAAALQGDALMVVSTLCRSAVPARHGAWLAATFEASRGAAAEAEAEARAAAGAVGDREFLPPSVPVPRFVRARREAQAARLRKLTPNFE